MENQNRFRKPIFISSIVLISLVLLIFVFQLILGGIVTSKIESAIDNSKSITYKVKVRKASINLFTSSIILKDIALKPDSSLLDSLRNGVGNHVAIDIVIPKLHIRNIGIINLLTRMNINLGTFILKDAKITVFNAQRIIKKNNNNSEKHRKPINLDSLNITGIDGGVISDFRLSNLSISIINALNNDTSFAGSNLDLKLKNVALTKNENDSTFNLKLKDMDLEMHDEKFSLPGNKYILTFKDFKFVLTEGTLNITDLKIVPRYSRKKLIAMSPYQYEIYDVDIDKITVNKVNFDEIVKKSKFYLSNVIVDGMSLNIFKDKEKPFDESKRPKLPSQLLKNMKQDLNIDSIIIRNSTLVYSEKHSIMDELMQVTLADFNVKVSNITSVFDSIAEGAVMKINLKANLQKKIPMNLDVYFPMKSISDTFMFAGTLGSGKMSLFNNVTLPAIGIKFENGTIDGIKFAASANSKYSMGEITMLYHDMEGSVQKQDVTEQNKFLSWAANSVLIKNNPIPDKDVRVSGMYFERVMYKGLGNYLWKTLQSGIVATIVPTMNNKVENQIANRLGMKPKEYRKHLKKKNRERRRRK